MLTQEEIQQLEIDRANAKLRCAEAWKVLQACEEIAKTYFKIHDHWREKFEKADRALAMERRSIETIKNKKFKKGITNVSPSYLGLSKNELETLLAELEKGEI